MKYQGGGSYNSGVSLDNASFQYDFEEASLFQNQHLRLCRSYCTSSVMSLKRLLEGTASM